MLDDRLFEVSLLLCNKRSNFNEEPICLNAHLSKILNSVLKRAPSPNIVYLFITVLMSKLRNPTGERKVECELCKMKRSEARRQTLPREIVEVFDEIAKKEAHGNICRMYKLYIARGSEFPSMVEAAAVSVWFSVKPVIELFVNFSLVDIGDLFVDFKLS